MRTLLSTLMISGCLILGSCNTIGQEKNNEVQKICLLDGDNPDPSITYHNGIYYMVHSSFQYSPGLIVYQSTDLVNWSPCSAALNKYVGSVWAPDICVYNNRFYIYFPTMGTNGNTNMVVWADDPKGPWSEPVDLKVKGIDPEHVVGKNGQRYALIGSGHLYPLSPDGLSITGNSVKIYNGWPIPEEWDREGASLEGLNVRKIGEYYYLLAADGGTAGPPTGHMVLQARSRNAEGPYENSPSNPLLRTESPDEQWWSQGHGQVIEGKNGTLYMVFHAYEKNYLTLGRQTLICEVEVDKEGWLQLKKGEISLPKPPKKTEKGISDFVWQTFKESLSERAVITADEIILKGKGTTSANSSPLLLRSGDHSYEFEACLTLTGDNPSAGLVLFYNSSLDFGFGFGPDKLIRYRRNEISNNQPLIPVKMSDGKCTLWVKIQNINHIVSGWYSTDGENWRKYPWGFDVQGVHHNTIGKYQFLSLRPGIFAGGEGEVKITNFVYRSLE